MQMFLAVFTGDQNISANPHSVLFEIRIMPEDSDVAQSFQEGENSILVV